MRAWRSGARMISARICRSGRPHLDRSVGPARCSVNSAAGMELRARIALAPLHPRESLRNFAAAELAQRLLEYPKWRGLMIAAILINAGWFVNSWGDRMRNIAISTNASFEKVWLCWTRNDLPIS